MRRPRPASSAGRSAWVRFALASVLFVMVFAGFIALGVWQVERRAWKLDLIARVDARLHAAPTPAPGPAAWASITPDASAYRRVRARGVFLNDRETLTEAVTDLGPGFWVLTPMQTDAGFTVLVNRGFVPPERRARAAHAAQPAREPAVVTGLLRISEPKGGFLRRNAPARGRWYSRDVAAIAQAKGLGRIAPYFIDADAASSVPGGPVGGLTVVRFPNSHLVYAITWFTLAALTAFGWLRIAVSQGVAPRLFRRRPDRLTRG